MVRPVTVERVPWSRCQLVEPLREQAEPAGTVHVDRGVPPAWLEVARAAACLRDDGVEVVDRQRRRPASCAIASRCSTALVEPPLADHRCDRVHEGVARQEPASRDARPRAPPRRARRTGPPRRPWPGPSRAPTRCPSARARGTRTTPAIVLAVNCPPHAPAPGQARVLDGLQLRRVDAAGRRARRRPRTRPGPSTPLPRGGPASMEPP